MVMESLDILAAKVKKAVENAGRLKNEIERLKEENLKLSVELTHFKGEYQSSKKTAAHDVMLRKNVAGAAVKIERLLKKIDSLK